MRPVPNGITAPVRAIDAHVYPLRSARSPHEKLRLGGIGAEMRGLDARRDAARRESASVGGIEQLDVLEPGHERDDAGGRLEDVEGCPNGGVADGMDLRRDVRPRQLSARVEPAHREA